MNAGVVTVRSTIDQALEAAILAGGEDVQPADDDGMVKV
jgi:hypothetical protein